MFIIKFALFIIKMGVGKLRFKMLFKTKFACDAKEGLKKGGGQTCQNRGG